MKRLLLLPVLALLNPMLSLAQTSTATLAVSATVLKVCLVVATPMLFGNYSASSASTNDATATVSVTCTVGTPYEVGLDAGTGTGATTTTRRMTFVSGNLSYQLFRDSGHSQNWGNSLGVDTVTGTGSGLLALHTVYGRIPTGQYSALGSYSDTITVTVSY